MTRSRASASAPATAVAPTRTARSSRSTTTTARRAAKRASTTPSSSSNDVEKGGHDFRIGSLFAGIGGLELGLEWSGIGRTVWQVERDPFCRAILAQRFPEAERFVDVRDVGAHNLSPIDLLCGGFPCQDVSGAGKGDGLSGARSGLWFEFDRIVGELRPTWVVVENVTSGAGKWLDAVRRCLEERGYETLPIPLEASDVGAPHRRARIFIVARLVDAVRPRREGRLHRAQKGRIGPSDPGAGSRLAHRGDDRREGSAQEHGEGRALGESRRRDAYGCDSRRDVSHADGEQIWLGSERESRRSQKRVCNEGGAFASNAGASRERNAEPVVGGVPHGLPAGLDGFGHGATRPVRWPARRGEPQHDWEPQRAVPASAIVDRDVRLSALGNAVVPQNAEVVGWVIRLLESGHE